MPEGLPSNARDPPSVVSVELLPTEDRNQGVIDVRWGKRMTRGPRPLLSFIAAGALTLAMLGPPAVAQPPADLPDVECDYTSDDFPDGTFAALCLQLRMEDGRVKFGDVDSDIEGPTIIQLDVAVTGDLDDPVIVPLGSGDNGAGNGGGPTFPPMEFEGGLLGALGVPLPPELADLIDPVNGLSAEIQELDDLSTGPIELVPFLTGEGELTTVNLPLRVQIHNLLLGDSCFIGSPEDPIDLNMVLTLIGGYELAGGGVPDLLADTAWTGLNLSDRSFGVPGARDCGPLGTGALLNDLGLGELNVFDQAINSSVGIPAPSGNLVNLDGWFGLRLICLDLEGNC
jgi:hypothetical protein